MIGAKVVGVTNVTVLVDPVVLLYVKVEGAKSLFDSAMEELVEMMVLLDVETIVELAASEVEVSNVMELIDPVALSYVKVKGVK